MIRRCCTALLVATVFLGSRSGFAQEVNPSDAYTFYGGYMWRQFVAQGVPSGDGFAMERGDFWGGRLVGGLGFGRLGFAVRLDAAGLKDQFDPNNPATFKTLEAYGAAYYVMAARSGMQVGPIFVVGSMTSLDSASDLTKQAWTGVGVNLAGGGLRVAGFGSEIELLAVGTRRYLVADPKVRLAFVAHVRLTAQMYAVGDALSGPDGFIRAGIAVRAF